MLRRNVLIFCLGALGDFVLTWPVALALARIFPQSRIHYVAHRQKGILAEKVLGIESADVEAGWHQLFSDPGQLPEPARKLLAGAHTVVSFIGGESDGWSRNVRSLAPDANLLELKPNPPAQWDRHVTEFHLEQLRGHPALAGAVSQIHSSITQRGVSPLPPGDTIVIHPGSGSYAKCWPRERFLSLIEALQRESRSVRVLLGEAELERWPPDELRRFESAAEVRRPASCLDLLRELRSARIAICNDSGPGHLAGIVGVPTVSIFGSTDPRIWRPLGPRVNVVSAQTLEAVSVEQVLSAVVMN